MLRSWGLIIHSGNLHFRYDDMVHYFDTQRPPERREITRSHSFMRHFQQKKKEKLLIELLIGKLGNPFTD